MIIAITLFFILGFVIGIGITLLLLENGLKSLENQVHTSSEDKWMLNKSRENQWYLVTDISYADGTNKNILLDDGRSIYVDKHNNYFGFIKKGTLVQLGRLGNIKRIKVGD